jgi:hypothetical protein
MPTLDLVFFIELFAMNKSVDDLQMLRLIKAFQKLSDQDTRRMVVLFVEEQVEKAKTKTTKGGPAESD